MYKFSVGGVDYGCVCGGVGHFGCGNSGGGGCGDGSGGVRGCIGGITKKIHA